MGKKSSYILLADYAKTAGISLEEARELVSREENKKFFKVANGKELISREIDKQTPPAPAPAPKEEAVEESKEEQPKEEEQKARRLNNPYTVGNRNANRLSVEAQFK